MSNVLDVMIAFVVVVIALSTTLQLFTNFMKGFLNLRWKVYEPFLRNFYAEHLGKQPEESKTDGPRIQSVTHRFKAFATKVKTFWETLQSAREMLETTQHELGACTDRKAKLEYLEKQLTDTAPILRIWTERIRGLNPDSLLSIYQKMRTRAEEVLDDQTLARTASYLSDLEQLIESARNAVAEGTDEALEVVESGIEQVLGAFRELELKLAGIHTRISVNMDDGLRRLQDSYERSVKKRCFWYGAALCVLANADAFLVYRTLQQNEGLTQGILEQQAALTDGRAAGTALVRSEQLNELHGAVAVLREEPGVAEDYATFRTRFDALADALRQDAATLATAPGIRSSIRVDAAGIKSRLPESVPTTPDQLPAYVAGLDSGLVALSTEVARVETARVRARVDQLFASSLPLGWSSDRLLLTFRQPLRILEKLFGLALMAFLISFGAPVWNDVLKSLIGLRARLQDKPAAAPPTGAVATP